MVKRIRSTQYLEWQRDHKSKLYKERRFKAIEKLGGKCVKCNSISNLHFDHIDPLTKKFPISRAPSEKLFWVEIKKCQLLCKKCHRIKSDSEISGENCYNSKLSESQVKNIRSRLLLGELGKDLAKQYSISPMQISRIKKGVAWSHVE